MQTKPLPEIAESDLKAAREFLTGSRDESRPGRVPRSLPVAKNGAGAVVRNGIARARMRPDTRADD